MFIIQQVIVAPGLLVVSWAEVYGLMCRGGHRKQPPIENQVDSIPRFRGGTR